MRFRTVPVEVDAICWDGTNWAELAAFAGLPGTQETEIARQMAEADGRARIPAPHAVIALSPGDWLIRSGDLLLRCRPDAFAQTYEPAEPAEISR